MTRSLLLVFAASFGATVSFYLLLSVVPLYATSAGASGIGAGMTTAVLMLSTVAAEFAIPSLVNRFGYRVIFGAGLFLLGVPALFLAESASMATILAVCVVRGLGFAVFVVVGSALVAQLVPPERRGEGLGVFGVVVGIPGVIALPLGVWLIGQVGYPPVFIAGAVAALAGLVGVAGLPGRAPKPEQSLSILGGLRQGALVRPAIVFSASAMASGVVLTFLPLALPNGSNLAALGLLAQAVAATIGRWWAGKHGDRHGPARLLIPGVVVAAVGLGMLVMIANPIAVLAGMLLFGAGFGVTQNASLTLMFNQVSPGGYGTVSALWNLAYDAGLGLGAAGFSVLATQTGYPAAFACTAVLMLVALAARGRVTKQ
ncbi:MAG TPA: MFS transporter [Micromonosporaceae bacterium]|nr:MFS transporter [Micromonosporaceae bacterium]